jgi:ferrous iron transport protein B
MFFLVVYLLFQLVFTLGEYPMEWVEEGILSLQIWCSSFWPAGDDSALHSLIVDGILGGVGGVLVFVPNIVLLFLGIALLDSTGYIARAAFLMDRVMRNFGLHGKSFLPLMCGFGCTVPAIMATRCLDDEKDRLTTMMVLPLMSCGARLPIYSLFIPVFFPLEWRGLILLGIYFSGAALSIIAALLLRRTIFKGKGSIFMMELPPLRFPKVSYLFSEMWERTKLYLHKVATLILMASVVIWALARYPQLPEKELERQDAELNLNDEKFLKSLTDALPEKGQRLGILLMEQRRLESEFVLDSEEYKAAKLGMKTEMDFYKESFSYLSDSSESLSQSSLQQQVKTIVSQWKDQRHSLQTEHSAKQLKNTVMGRVGHWISPLFRPLGFDWRISTALLGALPAKELFVTQLGVLFGLGSEEEGKLGEKIKGEVYGKGHPREGQSIFPPLAGLCVMLFCLIASPCIGTIAATIRETNSYFWGVTQFAGLSILAYVVTLVVYQVGSYLKLGLV